MHNVNAQLTRKVSVVHGKELYSLLTLASFALFWVNIILSLSCMEHALLSPYQEYLRLAILSQLMALMRG